MINGDPTLMGLTKSSRVCARRMLSVHTSGLPDGKVCFDYRAVQSEAPPI